MDSNPKPKVSKYEGNHDIISEMPDSILCKILSNVTTKGAVATSILSTRWKTVFPFGIPPIKLEFCDSILLYPQENQSDSPSGHFIDFVDKLLTRTSFGVPCVDKIFFWCKKNYGDAKIVSWVCAALKLNVRELLLYSTLDNSETLFNSLNGCKTLVRLELGEDFSLDVPYEFSLPNLKSLILFDLKLEHERGLGSINQLISGCPLLDTLGLNNCDMDNAGVLNIESKLLKTLTIERCPNMFACHLDLDVPNLEDLTLQGFTARMYWMASNLDYLRKAFIDIRAAPGQLSVHPSESEEDTDDDDNSDDDSDDDDDHYDDDNDVDVNFGVGVNDDNDDDEEDGLGEGYIMANGVAELVSKCSMAKRLYLSAFPFDILAHSTLMQLPTFPNLTCVFLGYLRSRGWSYLPYFLSIMPNLEELHLTEGFVDVKSCYMKFESSVTSIGSTPICLEERLKKIDFHEFQEEEDEVKLIEYFLDKGEALQKLTLRCDPFKDTNLLTRLLMLPKQSKLVFKFE